MITASKALSSFWGCYASLPEDIQRRADMQFALLMENPRHPSLHLKPVGEFWVGPRDRQLSRLIRSGGKRVHLVLDRVARRVHKDS